jgi:aminopeptidase N
LQLRNASKTDAIPILSEKASTLSYYQKGAWVLFVLREEIGSKIFQKAVKNYLNGYSFKNVSTDDFLNEIKKIAKYDCDAFKKKWLENPSFDFDYAIQLLSKNKSIKALLEIKSKKAIPFIEKRELFEKTMISDAYFPIKEEIIYQCEKVPFEEKQQLLKLALATNDINVRQAVANTTPKVTLEFKSDFESLLNDNSYITNEIALSTFWAQFPEDQKRILDKSKAWIGFNDNNLRILWLTLALGTKEYQMEAKAKFYDELLNYCNPEFETSIRQNAMENLLFVNDKDKNVLPNLVNSLVSYKWQFSKFGKDKIRLLLKNPNIRNYLEQLLPNLSKEENVILVKILGETSVK